MNIYKKEDEVVRKLNLYMKYLKDTDFKVLPDYDKDATEVITKRAEAREFIRANEGLIYDTSSQKDEVKELIGKINA